MQEIGNILTNVLDVSSGLTINYERVTKYYDGTDMTDAKADGKLYLKMKDGSGYVRQVLQGWGENFLNVDTMVDLRALDDYNLLLIKAGYYKGVTLLGYYEKNDKRGVNYTISKTMLSDNESSIIVIKDLCFLLEARQDITIIDFGILNDDTINQSIKLDALAKYCDDNNIYEIDFLNYKIQTSTTVHFTTTRGSRLSGIAFKKPKKIKNLTIQHDKSLTLFQGASLILWLPEYLPMLEETFELENVSFDPYNENYTLVSGEGDGMLGGFYCYRLGVLRELPSSTQTNYCLKLNSINFLSPAISRNISTANIKLKRLESKNLRGEYWALYTHIFALKSYYEDVVGVHRKDLQDQSSRNLVLTMIHHEPEVSGYTIPIELISVKGCQAYDNLGNLTTVYKHHTVDTAKFEVEDFIIDNVIGHVAWSVNVKCNAKNVLVQNITNPELNISLSGLEIYNLNIKDSYVPNILPTFASMAKDFDKVVISRSRIKRNFNNLQGAKNNINFLELNDVVLDKEDLLDTNGIFRSSSSTINNLKIKGVSNPNRRLVEAIISSIEIDGYNLDSVNYTNHIRMIGDDTTKKILINNLISVAEPSDSSTQLINASGTNVNIDFQRFTNSSTKRRLNIESIYESNVFPCKSSTTSNLPILDIYKIGYKLYDSTLKQYKIWNGSEWLIDSVKQSTPIANATSADATDLETALVLINELKAKLNAKLEADRASGQQAI